MATCQSTLGCSANVVSRANNFVIVLQVLECIIVHLMCHILHTESQQVCRHHNVWKRSQCVVHFLQHILVCSNDV